MSAEPSNERNDPPFTRFICEGCGVVTFQVFRPRLPAHGFCATCAWLNTHISDPAAIVALMVKERDGLKALSHDCGT